MRRPYLSYAIFLCEWLKRNLFSNKIPSIHNKRQFNSTWYSIIHLNASKSLKSCIATLISGFRMHCRIIAINLNGHKNPFQYDRIFFLHTMTSCLIVPLQMHLYRAKRLITGKNFARTVQNGQSAIDDVRRNLRSLIQIWSKTFEMCSQRVQVNLKHIRTLHSCGKSTFHFEMWPIFSLPLFYLNAPSRFMRRKRNFRATAGARGGWGGRKRQKWYLMEQKTAALHIHTTVTFKIPNTLQCELNFSLTKFNLLLDSTVCSTFVFN